MSKTPSENYWRFFAKFLIIFSNCTFHFCRDHGKLNIESQELLFDLSIKSQNILLLTTGFKAKPACPVIAIYNNWHNDNFYQSGRFERKKYKREIFKYSRFLQSCKVHVVEANTTQKQVFTYLDTFIVSPKQEAKIPDYLLLIFWTANLCKKKNIVSIYGKNVTCNERKSSYQVSLRIHSTLPIFILLHEDVYFAGGILSTKLWSIDKSDDVELYTELSFNIVTMNSLFAEWVRGGMHF